MNSQLFSLAKSDYAKGLVVAVLTPVVAYIGQILQGGGLAIDWNQVAHLALTGFIAYIAKNFLSTQDGKFGGVIG